MNCALYNCYKSVKKGTSSRSDWPAYSIWLIYLIFHLCFCQEWELQAVGDEKRIILTFEHFDIIPHTTGACIYNYIEISHGNFKWRFCGNTIPEPFTSSGSSMTVKFQSIYQNSNLGNVFLASWNEVAGLSMSF